MDGRKTSGTVRSTILELVGQGRTAVEIRDRLTAYAYEHDLRYADSLVKVRDEVRNSEKLQTQAKPAPAGA
jgi:hypothetical protein